ncbi:hypothetical protein KJ766_02185 [Patescibacteria group bacterium]|nr:hypothetical protein [Patescibacteria group bacterium]
MTLIYGVDPNVPFDAKDVRNAIVECFTQAHSEVLDQYKEVDPDISEIELESIKHINVEQQIRNAFKSFGGDFDNPTKESILNVMLVLKDFAKSFRSPEIIEKHFGDIKSLVDKL